MQGDGAGVTWERWDGCYDSTWRNVLVPAAFAHPAKASRDLLDRIFRELLAAGALTRGDTVLDPFGGVGTTGIAAAYHGLKFVGCELEPRFRELALENFALHAPRWQAAGLPVPEMLLGDSRRLCERLRAAALVSSPPYASGGVAGGDQRNALARPADVRRERGRGKRTASLGLPSEGYGHAPGQLGVMPPGDLRAVVSSPPYSGIASGAGGLNTKPPTRAGQQAGRSASSASQDTDQRYGSTEGQMAKLPEETFWQAARDVVEQCRAALPAGAAAVWIVKHFVQRGRLVDFPDDWRQVCEACGFETVRRARAMLTLETRVPHLWDGESVQKKERKSFFRRLAESKGAPRVDWETVWFMRRA